MLYINDLPDTLVCNCMMFADDANSFREVADMNMLQNDLHLMEKWCIHELLSTGLEHVLEEKDLGIIRADF